MKLLLDTHALIWSLTDPDKLPEKLRSDLQNTEVVVCYSSVSALEMNIKIQIGKLGLDIEGFFAETRKIGFEEAPFLSRHAVQMTQLPPIHSDPFDRALIAQSLADQFVFVTKDRTIQKYPLSQRWD
jgi:PIN domain nuclease of toxin-antitoxin system